MKYDPLHQELFTDDGRFIKKLHCPKSLAWDELEEGKAFERFCATCEVKVLDTRNETDESMLELMKNQPGACIKLDLEQANLTIINHGEYQSK